MNYFIYSFLFFLPCPHCILVDKSLFTYNTLALSLIDFNIFHSYFSSYKRSGIQCTVEFFTTLSPLLLNFISCPMMTLCTFLAFKFCSSIIIHNLLWSTLACGLRTCYQGILWNFAIILFKNIFLFWI